MFKIVLISTIGGGVIETEGGVNEAILTISASDYPYGLFSFPSGFRPIIVSESSSLTKNLTVLREFGTSGTVRIDYWTVMATSLGKNL